MPKPYNIEFCRFIECPNLREDGKCRKKKKECPYNLKWIKYWEAFGIYPPEGIENA